MSSHSRGMMHASVEGIKLHLCYGSLEYNDHGFIAKIPYGEVWRYEQAEDNSQMSVVADDGYHHMMNENRKSAKGQFHGGCEHDKTWHDETIVEDYDPGWEERTTMSGNKGPSQVRFIKIVSKRTAQLATNETALVDLEKAKTGFQRRAAEVPKRLGSAIEPTLRLRGGGGDNRKAERRREHSEHHESTRGNSHYHRNENRNARFVDNDKHYETQEWRDIGRQHGSRQGINLAGHGQYPPTQYSADPFRPFHNFSPFAGRTASRDREQARHHHTDFRQGHEADGRAANMGRDSREPFSMGYRRDGPRNWWNPFEQRGATFGVPSSSTTNGGRRRVGFEFFPFGFLDAELPRPIQSLNYRIRRSRSPPSRRSHRKSDSPTRHGSRSRIDHSERRANSYGSSESEDWQSPSESDETHGSVESEDSYNSAKSEYPADESPPPDHYATLGITPECTAKEYVSPRNCLRSS